MFFFNVMEFLSHYESVAQLSLNTYPASWAATTGVSLSGTSIPK